MQLKQNKLIKFLFILMGMCFCQYISAKEIQYPNQLPSHPRLLWGKNEIKEVKRLIAQEPAWKELHQVILKEADQICHLPLLEREKIGLRLLQTSREELRRVLFLSYAYRMTKQEKYAQRAEKEMLQVCDFSDWNPSHFLDVAEMTLALAIGYDWLYSELSEQSKKVISSSIIEKGIKTSFPETQGNDFFSKRRNNWNQVCNAGISWGALAVYEENPTLSQKVVNRAVETIPLSMAGYAPDGAYPEGIGYWKYGTTFNVLLLDALESALGTDYGLSDLEGFLETGLYAQHMITPNLKSYNYCDNKSGASFQTASFWFYKQTQDPTILFIQGRLLEQANDSKLVKDRFLPLSLIWAAKSKARFSDAKLPQSLSYLGEGINPVAVFRTDWESEDAMYVGFKVGKGGIEHGHQDVGSFFLELDGVNWALDLGQEDYTQLEQYGVLLWSKQRYDVFRHGCFSHNVVNINGKHHNPKTRVEFAHYEADDQQMQVSAELSPLYDGWLKGYERKVIAKKNATLEIHDKITTNRHYTEMSWTMATPADRIEVVSPNKVVLHCGDKRLALEVEGAEDLDLHFDLVAANSGKPYDTINEGVNIFTIQSILPMGKTTDLKMLFYRN